MINGFHISQINPLITPSPLTAVPRECSYDNKDMYFWNLANSQYTTCESNVSILVSSYNYDLFKNLLNKLNIIYSQPDYLSKFLKIA